MIMQRSKTHVIPCVWRDLSIAPSCLDFGAASKRPLYLEFGRVSPKLPSYIRFGAARNARPALTLNVYRLAPYLLDFEVLQNGRHSLVLEQPFYSPVLPSF